MKKRKTKSNTTSLVPQEIIERKILSVRGKKVMLDRDLANLYGVKTYRLNEAVRRNQIRFPDDFMFKLTKNETDELIANCDRFRSLKHSSSFPNAFTQEGVAMLSSVLNSETAININIQIMRVFVRLRELFSSNVELRQKVEDIKDNMEKKFKKHDKQFDALFEAFETIKQMIIPQEKVRRITGFQPK